MDETMIDLPDAIREGCALRLTRDVTDAQGRTWPKGAQVTCCGRLLGLLVTEIDAPLATSDVVIDLDPVRASGQWAVAMWAMIHRDAPQEGAIRWALTGAANPAELRRVALEVRGG